MHYHKSPLRKFKNICLGIYYDYRKIIAVFCCYSFLGTGLILNGASVFGEDSIFYCLSKREEQNTEKHHEALTAEAASSRDQSILDAVNEIKSRTTSYSLTGATSESGKARNTVTDDLPEKDSTKSSSQKESMASTAANAEKEASSQDKNSGKKTSSQNKTSQKNKKNKHKTYYDISQFSEKEIRILERIVEAEAGDQSLKGRIMVAHVVLNRVASDEFPDTIKNVVFQKNSSVYQFSPVKDKRYYHVKVSKKTKKAVAKAFQTEDLTDGALYFMSRSGSSSKNIQWFDSSLTKITSYGCHEFFK